MSDRYNVTKRKYRLSQALPSFLTLMARIVMNVLFTRSLGARIAESSPLIIDCLTPSLCHSDLGRDLPLLLMPLMKVFMFVFARKTIEGAKTYVWAALAGKSQDQDALRKDLRGAFTMDCEIAEPSDYVLSKEGQEAENKLWVSATVPYVKTAIIMLTNTIRTRR
jgi:retinol dehydrogenase-12